MDRSPLDTALIALAEGDRAAFDTVWTVASPRVRALCGRMLGDGADADDAAQTALAKVFEHIDRYDPERPALPWILGIAAWECRTVRKQRTRSREHAVAEAPPAVDAGPGPESALIDAELEAALTEVLGTLKPVDRQTLEAVLERRARPDVPGATFRKRVQRALARLKLAWGERHDLG